MNAAKTNHISLSFDAISENEAFARMTAAMFMAQLNPTLDDVEDVKTAVSEAVTNAIIHGYEMGDEIFHPIRQITRQQKKKVVHRYI